MEKKTGKELFKIKRYLEDNMNTIHALDQVLLCPNNCKTFWEQLGKSEYELGIRQYLDIAKNH